MKSRTVITLWIIALVLGAIACIVQFGGDDDSTTRTKLAPGEKILPDLPIREISKVTLSQGKNKTQLTRLNNQEWGVAERGDYPINYEKLRNLLGTLGEIEVTQGYPADNQHFARFGLAEASEEEAEQGLHVIMETADGSKVADIFLGKYSGAGRAGGRFMRTAKDDTGVYAVGETFPGITATPEDWLDKDFLKIEKIKSIALSAPDDPAFKPWKLIRHPNTDGTVNENGQLKLADMTDKETMQLTSTNPLRNLFSYTSFQDLLTETKAKETANPDVKLKRSAVITTFDGFTYHLTFWPQKEKPKDPNADPRLPAVQPNYLLTVTVTADMKEKRTPSAGEKPEEAQKLDAEFTAQQKALKEKLAATAIYKNRIYQISQSTISPLQKTRSDFVKAMDKPTATTPPVRIPPAQPQLPTVPQP